jgi:GT2 family glycosyltransferase
MSFDIVQVVVPTRGNPRAEVVSSIERVCRRSLAPKYLIGNAGAAETKARAVKWFMEECVADRLIIVDDDIIVPPNFLDLACRDADIVAAICPVWVVGTKQVPFYNAYRAVQGGYAHAEINLKGMQEVDAVGGGALCLTRKVLADLKPVFTDKYDEWGVLALGEDFHFCQRAKAKGYKVWADFSIRCEHIKTVLLEDYAIRVIKGLQP